MDGSGGLEGEVVEEVQRCNGATVRRVVSARWWCAGGSGRLETRGLAQKAYAARGGGGGRVEKLEGVAGTHLQPGVGVP